ncbi:MAG: MotA/TolQ/ExbB proton channel family protein [Endozoicomonadaceae bacterium]|nr:MotA/TolQ/ExbB proton channel family protein [Endozoicomonadaceae bacterium]
MAQQLPSRRNRLLYAGISLVAAVIFITALHFILTAFNFNDAAAILLDYRPDHGSYPITVQNIMWLVFFLGIAELFGRYQDGQTEENQLHMKYLPEDDRTMLDSGDLGGYYKKIRNTVGDSDLFLPRLIKRIIFQFQGSKSIAQANSLLNSSLDLYLHEIDLRYNILRYIMWLIPSLGFIGTVIGISLALNFAGGDGAGMELDKLLPELTSRLAVAFYTTLLALVQSVFLVFSLHIIQAKEERCLNKAGQYCLDNLINRLYVH